MHDVVDTCSGSNLLDGGCKNVCFAKEPVKVQVILPLEWKEVDVFPRVEDLRGRI